MQAKVGNKAVGFFLINGWIFVVCVKKLKRISDEGIGLYR